MIRKMLLLLAVSLLLTGAALAQENDGKTGEVSPVARHIEEHGAAKQIPEQVSRDNWAYLKIAELQQKYETKRKLPEGRLCSKGELAQGLLAVLDNVLEKYQKEGAQAISRDDLESMVPLHKALEQELAGLDGYRLRKKSIEEILVESEQPPFLYKIGVKGVLRGEGGNNFNLTDFSHAPDHGEGRIVYRVQPYVYWHPTDCLDIHLEGQGYGFNGGSSDYHELSLYQGFVEARVPGQDWVALKGGRQEFSYGSGFILGADSFYDGLSFDAVRLRLKPLDGLTVDLLGGRYATPFSGGLKGDLTGAYLTYAPTEQSALDLYGFRDTGAPERHNGEHLESWGLRGTYKLGALVLEFEPVYQSGKRFNPDTGANEEINAYGGHVDLTGEAQVGGFKNKVLLSYAVGSGNRGAASKEFRHPDNDTSLIGDMGVLDLSGVDAGESHASGAQIYTLGWGMDLTGQLNFSASAHEFVANSVPDGFSRHLGLETDFTLTYTMNDDFSLLVGYDRFFTGKFFRDASGSDQDINYGYAMLVFNFDKTKPKLHKIPKGV
jgi:hypothetical protein